MYNLIPYDKTKYNFVELVQSLFDKDLQDLHEEHKELFKVGADSVTAFHDAFYNKCRSGWDEMNDLYLKFISEVVAPNYEEDFLFQALPTFRVHLRDNVAVGAFHTDAEFNHPAGEMNYIIPLTKSFDTASVWVETEIGSEDYCAMPMVVGNLIQFNGNQLRHGNKINLTNHTRVSMDFRILPISKYNESESAESITRKTKFKENFYYRRFIKHFNIQ